jgi:hypothetical protein
VEEKKNEEKKLPIRPEKILNFESVLRNGLRKQRLLADSARSSFNGPEEVELDVGDGEGVAVESDADQAGALPERCLALPAERARER